MRSISIMFAKENNFSFIEKYVLVFLKKKKKNIYSAFILAKKRGTIQHTIINITIKRQFNIIRSIKLRHIFPILTGLLTHNGPSSYIIIYAYKYQYFSLLQVKSCFAGKSNWTKYQVSRSFLRPWERKKKFLRQGDIEKNSHPAGTLRWKQNYFLWSYI